MFFNKIFRRFDDYFAIGKDVYDHGRELIRERLQAKTGNHTKKRNIGSSSFTPDENVIIPEADNSFIKGKQQSLRSSQGVSDHSGSSYRGPGSAGEKVNSNMAQRNFENHQGN